MTHELVGLLLVLAQAPDSAALSRADSVEASRRGVVRRLEEVVVRASPLHDVLSSQSVQIVTRESLRELPLDRLAEALALKAGVVATAEELHVRGGRAGETQLLLAGIPLDEPLRRRPMELPLSAVESVELVSGGLDAEYGGALAGVLRARTLVPGQRFSAEARWDRDLVFDPWFGRDARYRRYLARVNGPLFGPVGAVVAADITVDDTWLPALRARPRFGSWRADNRLLGYAKLGAPQGQWALELLGNRRVERPFDPLWSLDGWTTPCADPLCLEGPAFSTDPLPGYQRFVGPERAVMADDRRLAAVLSGRMPLGPGTLRGALGWIGARRLVSVGGQDDEWYLTTENHPLFGRFDSPVNDPVRVYGGYEPFFHRSRSQAATVRADWDRVFTNGSRQGLGAGFTHESVELRELDTSTRGTGIDSLRAFDTHAPGGFAYGQGRWIFQGLVLNGGLRFEYFTAGSDAGRQSFGAPARGIWSVAPRVGVAYPMSTRDVLSLSYIRIDQPPPRIYLYENRSFISARQPLGNPALEPMTVISYQVAVKHLFDEGRAVQAAVFYRDLFGQIGARAFDPGPGIARPRYENEDSGHAEGFELGVFWPFGENARFEAQYAFMHAFGNMSQPEGLPFGARFATPSEIVGEHPLDWDRRHSVSVSGVWRRPLAPMTRPPKGPLELVLAGLRGSWTIGWATRIGSGLPWTPNARREQLTDLSLVNSERLAWEENTSFSARWLPWFGGGRLALGLEVRNLFDTRGARAATIEGYPHPLINTAFDDYGAHRRETGQSGGGYWDSDDPDAGSWVATHDPRLFQAPRLMRVSVGTSF